MLAMLTDWQQIDKIYCVKLPTLLTPCLHRTCMIWCLRQRIGLLLYVVHLWPRCVCYQSGSCVHMCVYIRRWECCRFTCSSHRTRASITIRYPARGRNYCSGNRCAHSRPCCMFPDLIGAFLGYDTRESDARARNEDDCPSLEFIGLIAFHKII